VAVSGVGDRWPGTISGRARGNRIVSAVPTELAATKKALRQRKLAVMFRRAYLGQETRNMGGPFDIGSRSGGNLQPFAVCMGAPRMPTDDIRTCLTSKGSASTRNSLTSEAGHEPRTRRSDQPRLSPQCPGSRWILRAATNRAGPDRLRHPALTGEMRNAPRPASTAFPKLESYRAHRRVGKIAWHGRCDDARRHAILPTRSDQAARPDRVGKGARRPHECGQPCQAPLPPYI
jgi:hypothetical protein